MKILVVYDSYFGNTQKIAETVAGELSRTDEVEVVKAATGQFVSVEGKDVVVIGSPTRAFSATPPIKEFLKGISRKDMQQMKIALFDTRADVEKINSKLLGWMMRGFGYANDTMLKLIRGKGGELVCTPAAFFVADKEGPLVDGEIKRALAWARLIKQGRS